MNSIGVTPVLAEGGKTGYCWRAPLANEYRGGAIVILDGHIRPRPSLRGGNSPLCPPILRPYFSVHKAISQSALQKFGFEDEN